MITGMNWKQAADSYFKTHETLNNTNRDWLKANVALDCKKLLKDMTRDEVLAIAEDPNGHGFSAARLARTVVWQSLALTLCGKADPLSGNIRRFYYVYLDPVFTQFDLYSSLTKDPGFQAYVQELTETFPYTRFSAQELEVDPRITKSYAQDLNEDTLRDFVLQGIFRYQGPFLFTDMTAGLKLMGTHNASMIVVVEKGGLFSVIQKYHNLYGTTAMASDGNPSWLAVEYLSDQLKARKIRNIHLATINDWDPGGFNIADDYRHKFEFFGFRVKATMITNISLFTKEKIRTSANDLTHVRPNKQKETDEWFAKTNGINGRKAGIHVDDADFKRVDKAVDRWFQANSPKAKVEDYEIEVVAGG